MADESTNPLQRPLPDGIVPEDEVARTENRWVIIMLGMLGVMMAIIVVTGVTNALHPPSNVETIDPTTLHLGGEFAESNLGTAARARRLGHGPADRRAVRFRAGLRASPGRYAGEIPPHQHRRDSRVPASRDQREHDGGAGLRRRSAHQIQPSPASTICRAMNSAVIGHHGMWARVNVVPKEQFPQLAALERTSCAKQ